MSILRSKRRQQVKLQPNAGLKTNLCTNAKCDQDFHVLKIFKNPKEKLKMVNLYFFKYLLVFTFLERCKLFCIIIVMKNVLFSLIAAFSLSAIAQEKPTTADHLQNVSVTIRSEGQWSNGEGSGVIFTRKDAKGNQVNFVWTAAHVIDNLRSTREVLVNGSKKTIVEFKDPMIVKEIRQNGRTVGRLQMDAEVLKYSDADDGHDSPSES